MVVRNHEAAYRVIARGSVPVGRSRVHDCHRDRISASSRKSSGKFGIEALGLKSYIFPQCPDISEVSQSSQSVRNKEC